MRISNFCVWGVAIGLVLVGCSSGEKDASSGGSNAAPSSSAVSGSSAAPAGGASAFAAANAVLQAKCLLCHGGKGVKGGFSVVSYDTIMKGGKGGAEVIAGDPEGSPLVMYIEGRKTPKMPMGDRKVEDAELAAIKAWIKDGAKA